MALKISVIVCAHKRSAVSVALSPFLLAQSRLPNEILVINNASRAVALRVPSGQVVFFRNGARTV